MIAKVVPKHDKTSGKRPSFGGLANYLTGIKGLTDYMTKDGERVDASFFVNCSFEDSQKDLNIKEIEALQKLNKSKGDKTYHLVISLREGERLNRDQMERSVKLFMQTLGFEGHQAMVASHIDTSNFHMHVAINRVSPKTRNLVAPYKDFEKLDRMCAQQEKMFDLQPDNRIGQGKDKPKAKRLPSGRQSFQEWVQDLKPEIMAVVEKADSWDALQKGLAEFNVGVRKRGAGFVVSDLKNPYFIKASSVSRSMGKKQLEDRIGQFQEVQKTELPRPKIQYDGMPKGVKSDSPLYVKFLQHKLSNASERQQRLTALQSAHNDRVLKLQEWYQNCRKDTYRTWFMMMNRKEKYRLTKRNRDSLFAELEKNYDHHEQEREKIQRETRDFTWKEFVAKEAEAGNLHAINLQKYRKIKEKTAVIVDSSSLKDNPDFVLEQISAHQSTFTEDDIHNFVYTHCPSSDFDEVVSKVMESDQLELIKENDYARYNRYTTKKLLKLEQDALQKAETLSKTQTHNIEDSIIDFAAEKANLSPEQNLVLKETVSKGDVAIIIGGAGTGKSYTLNGIREAYDNSGYTLKGVSLSGVAVDNLAKSSGIESYTIHQILKDWEIGENQIDSKSVLVVDEAGMVGTRMMERLISEVSAKNAKLILIGDTQQTQAIEAGGIFRGIVERVGSSSLKEVWRQSDPWQRDAVAQLAGGRAQISTALDVFKDHGCINEFSNADAAKAQMLDDYTAAYDSDRISVMVAHTNEDVGFLNNECRERLQSSGVLETEQEVPVDTPLGKRMFTPGDRVLFLKNNRILGVKNGMFGTLERVSDDNRFVVRSDDGKALEVDPAEYSNFVHGYAATVHKLQGATIDDSYILASNNYDKHLSYVALSRHKKSMSLYYGKDEFQNFNHFKRQLSNSGHKELLQDYDSPEIGNYEAFVQKITKHSSTFDEKKYQAALEKFDGSGELPVFVGVDEAGNKRYSLPSVIECEKNLFSHAQSLSGRHRHVLPDDVIVKTSNDHHNFVVNKISKGSDISVLNYEYGAEKGAVIESIGTAYRNAGYIVEGVALSGASAERLNRESGVDSDTVFKKIFDWENDVNKLTDRSVLIVDGANLIGTQDAEKILREAETVGAKLILVGEEQRLQAISAGNAFRGIIDKADIPSIQIKASESVHSSTLQFQNLLQGSSSDVAAALDILDETGCIFQTDSTVSAAAEAWAESVNLKNGKGSQDSVYKKLNKTALLAHSNKVVDQLNSEARDYLFAAGFLDKNQSLAVETHDKGILDFRKGDRIMFLKNDVDLEIKNGTTGTVDSIDGRHLIVGLDNGGVVMVDTLIYRDLTHGYASTVHKAGTGKFSKSFVVAGNRFNRSLTAAALSSHTDGVSLFHDFKNHDDLKKRLTKEGSNDLVADYPMMENVWSMTVQGPNGETFNKRVIVKHEITKKLERAGLRREMEQFTQSLIDQGKVDELALGRIHIKADLIKPEKRYSKEEDKDRDKILRETESLSWIDFLVQEATRGNQQAIALLRKNAPARRKGNFVEVKSKFVVPGFKSVNKQGDFVYQFGKVQVRDDGGALRFFGNFSDINGMKASLDLLKKKNVKPLSIQGTPTFKKHMAFVMDNVTDIDLSKLKSGKGAAKGKAPKGASMGR